MGNHGSMSYKESRSDVFISYAGHDRAWAEWIASELEAHGLSVEFGTRDWLAGDNGVGRMVDALRRADLIISVWSVAYFEREQFTTDEWAEVMRARLDPTGQARLIPLRIEQVTPPPMLKSLVYWDLYGRSEAAARDILLSAIGKANAGKQSPRFPGTEGTLQADIVRPGAEAFERSKPRLPGVLPRVQNLPTRSAAFTGRGRLLVALREQLSAGSPVVAVAFHGLGGVGKTTLALEYAYQLSGAYDIIWWVDCERIELIEEQFAALATEAGWVNRTADTPVAVASLRRSLSVTPGWLLIFDNAENPGALRFLLPQGPGHILITSRNPSWKEVASPVDVDVFAREESVGFLCGQVPTLSSREADSLADALGDLPLALAQAVGVLAETQMPVDDYLTALGSSPGEVMGAGAPAAHRNSLSASVSVSVLQLGESDRAAVQLIEICAFLAPEPIPVELFTIAAAADALDDPLATQSRSPYGVRRAMSRVGRYGLGRVGREGLIVHRLTQAVLRDRMTDEQRQTALGRAQSIVVAAAPSGSQEPGLWETWSRILPHIVAIDPPTTDNRDVLDAAGRAAWYLLNRADLKAALILARALHERSLALFGPADPTTLQLGLTRARAHRDVGEFQEALVLDQDVLRGRRELFGNDDRRTLYAAACVALVLHDLGSYEEARQLNQETLERCREILGPDDPDTLTTAHGLAGDLRGLGDFTRALDLDEDNSMRRRRTLGEDHPHTLRSAHSLAEDFRATGQQQAAKTLDDQTLAYRRQVFGVDHPESLRSLHSLAADLRELGRYREAMSCDEDALARRTRVLGKRHPDTLESARSLRGDLKLLGQIERANEIAADFDLPLYDVNTFSDRFWNAMQANGTAEGSGELGTSLRRGPENS
jgi:tetratricopeptide (TPR) repeat protein